MKIVRTNRWICLAIIIIATAIMCTACYYVASAAITDTMESSSTLADEEQAALQAKKFGLCAVITRAVLALTTIIITVCIEYKYNVEHKACKVLVILINCILALLGTGLAAVFGVLLMNTPIAGWKIMNPTMLFVPAIACAVASIIHVLANIFIYAPFTRSFPKQK